MKVHFQEIFWKHYSIQQTSYSCFRSLFLFIGLLLYFSKIWQIAMFHPPMVLYQITAQSTIRQNRRIYQILSEFESPACLVQKFKQESIARVVLQPETRVSHIIPYNVPKTVVSCSVYQSHNTWYAAVFRHNYVPGHLITEQIKN